MASGDTNCIVCGIRMILSLATICLQIPTTGEFVGHACSEACAREWELNAPQPLITPLMNKRIKDATTPRDIPRQGLRAVPLPSVMTVDQMIDYARSLADRQVFDLMTGLTLIMNERGI